MSTKQVAVWDWDLRVRERNLKSGLLSEKEVDKFLSQLPDVADQAENFGTAQPALGGREEST